jgi:hypothetical protein
MANPEHLRILKEGPNLVAGAKLSISKSVP